MTHETKTDLARALIDEFPDAPSRTLGKMLRERHPGAFPSLDAARYAVRTARGAIGRQKRANVRPDKFSAWARSMASVEARIPEETVQELPPHPIETGWRYLILADAHIPEHSRLALETAIDYGVKQGCNAILELGDMSECKDTARFDNEPGVTLAHEIRARAEYMAYVRPKFKQGPYYSKMGNHEDNVRRYIIRNAPALVGLPCTQFHEIMPFANHGAEVIDSKTVIKAGKIDLIHGHEYRGGGGVSPARWLHLRAGTCSVCGHFHRTSSHAERRMDGFEVVSFTVGCLRTRNPEWCSLNQWNWGFAVMDLAADGDFEFRNYRILSRGEVVPG